MKKLGTVVAIIALLALASGAPNLNRNLIMFAVAAFVCAYTTIRSRAISSFLQIFVGIFSFEATVFGLQLLLEVEGLWPESLANYAAPESLGLAVVIFSVLVFAISHLDIIRQTTRIADRYFDAQDEGEARIGSLFHVRSKERNIAVMMIVVLVIINQTQVGISVRLSFFNRDWFNAIQRELWRILATTAFGVRPLGVHLCRDGRVGIRYTLVSGDSVEALAHRGLRVTLAWGACALSHSAFGQSDRQSRPTHRRGYRPVHRRRDGGIWDLLVFDSVDFHGNVARLLLSRLVGSFGELSSPRN